MAIRKHVIYSGRVQGVGFRYTAQGLAQRFGVAGHVRNLPNGDVELVAEGPAEEVDGLLDAVAERMAGYIRNQTVRDEPPSGATGFTIRH
jgi:acylphosphatase